MSIPVPMTELPEALTEFGMVAYLLSAGVDGRPRPVSVKLSWQNNAFVLSVGRRTAANIVAQPLVSLLWPGALGGPWSLIVEAFAAPADPTEQDLTEVRLVPTSGVRHKNAVPG